MCIHLRNCVSSIFSINFPYFLQIILTYKSVPLFYANISSISFFDVSVPDSAFSIYS